MSNSQTFSLYGLLLFFCFEEKKVHNYSVILKCIIIQCMLCRVVLFADITMVVKAAKNHFNQ